MRRPFLFQLVKIVELIRICLFLGTSAFVLILLVVNVPGGAYGEFRVGFLSSFGISDGENPAGQFGYFIGMSSFTNFPAFLVLLSLVRGWRVTFIVSVLLQLLLALGSPIALLLSLVVLPGLFIKKVWVPDVKVHQTELDGRSSET